MIAIDTNVLIRIFIDDGGEQPQIARDFVNQFDAVYITQAVQLEFIWVLKYTYKFDKSALLTALKVLQSRPLYQLQHRDDFDIALDFYEKSNADFSDYIIISESQKHDMTLWTFDKKLSKHDNAKLLSADLN